MTSASNVLGTATDAISLTADNSNINLTATTASVAVTAGTDVLATAAQVVALTATNSNITLVAGASIVSTATNNFDVNAHTSRVMSTTNTKLQATSNTYIDMYNNSLTAQSFGVTINADSALTIKDTADTKYYITGSSTSGDLELAASHDAKMSASNSNIFVAPLHAFKDSANLDIITIREGSGLPSGSNVLTVYGNVDVTGVINSISITEQTLEISDKTIVLSHNSNINETVDDGLITNDGAGVVIDGMPAQILDHTNTSNIETFEKSLKWNYGTAGMAALRTDVATESYWELKGGGLRITSVNANNDWASDGLVNDTDTVSYTFRVNQRKGLELVRSIQVNGGPISHSRVAVFGLQRSLL